MMEREFFNSVRPSSLIQRFARTEEVAAMVAFVASPLSSATNGAEGAGDSVEIAEKRRLTLPTYVLPGI